MGKTLAEKIPSNWSDSDARAGDIVIAKVGLFAADDITRDYPVSQGQGDDFNPVSPGDNAVIKNLEELSRDQQS